MNKLNYLSQSLLEWIRSMPIDRDRLSYSKMLPSGSYVIYYNIPKQYVSLCPIAVCDFRDEAEQICEAIPEEEIRKQINLRYEGMEATT